MILLSLWLQLVTQSAHAWGPIGHRVIAELADERLSPVAKARLKSILGKESLADVANWPDLVRSDPAWRHADPWHYVTVEDAKSYDPKSANPNGDVIEAIERFSRELAQPKTTVEKQRQAVAWLVHLVGDIHQPLHVGRGADRGGNEIQLKWFGKKTNLHSIWDEKLIEMEQLSYSEYVRFVNKASDEEKLSWSKTPLFGWALESQGLRGQVYSYPKKDSKYWEYDYRYRMQPILQQRLQQAGVRLATLLNGVLRPQR